MTQKVGLAHLAAVASFPRVRSQQTLLTVLRMADLLALMDAAVEITVTYLATAEGLSALAFLDRLAAVAASLWDHDLAGCAVSFMTGSFAGVQSAVEFLGTQSAAASLVEFATHAVDGFGSTVAADSRNNNLARRTGASVTKFSTSVRTLTASVASAALPTRVGLDEGVGLGVLLFEAEAVVGRHRLLRGRLAVRTRPAVHLLAVGRLWIVVLDVVLLADPVFQAFEMTSDAATLAAPHCAGGRTLQQADDAFSPLIDLLLSFLVSRL